MFCSSLLYEAYELYDDSYDEEVVSIFRDLVGLWCVSRGEKDGAGEEEGHESHDERGTWVLLQVCLYSGIYDEFDLNHFFTRFRMFLFFVQS